MATKQMTAVDRLHEAIRKGEAAKFGDAPLRAELLRQLLSGRGLGSDCKVEVGRSGLLIVEATIEGDVDLDNLQGCDGSPLPALQFEGCTFQDRFSARHANFARLSFSGCRFSSRTSPAKTPAPRPPDEIGAEPPAADDVRRPTLDLSGVQTGTNLNLSGIRPVGNADELWIGLAGARIDGDLNLRRAKLKAPPGRDALDFSLAEIKGDAMFMNGFEAAGRIKGRGAHIDGDLWMTGASLDGRGGTALFLQSACIGGLMVLEGRPDEGPGARKDPDFHSKGQVNLHQLQLKRKLYIGNALIEGSSDGDDADRQVALCLEGAVVAALTIGTRDRKTRLEGELQLAYLTVQSAFRIANALLGMKTRDITKSLTINGPYISAKVLTIEDIQPLAWEGDQDFEPQRRLLSVDLTDARLDKLEVSNSRIDGYFKAAPLHCTGDVSFDARIGTELDLEGSNIGGSLDISRLRMDRTAKLLSLKDANIARALRIAHRMRPGEARAGKLLSARMTRLTCLPDASLVETLWQYESDSGKREVRQVAFLERRDVIRALDRRADTLRNFVDLYGHTVDNEARAAEFARLYCGYGQSECRARWVLTTAAALPPYCEYLEMGDEAGQWVPLEKLGEQHFGMSSVPPGAVEAGTAYAFEACVLLAESLERGRIAVKICGKDIHIGFERRAKPLEVRRTPVSTGPFVVHPGGVSPVPSPWPMPAILEETAPVDPRKLRLVEERLRPHLGSDFSIYGTADLRDLSCDTLDDQGGRFWGRHVSLDLNHFVYRQATWEPDGKPPHLSFKQRRRRWVDRMKAEYLWSRLIPARDRDRLRERTDLWEPWQVRRNWIYQQFEASKAQLSAAGHRIREFEYRPQPFEQAVRVARGEGRAEFAVQLEMLKSRIEWQFFNRRNRWTLGFLGIFAACVYLIVRAWRREAWTSVGVTATGLLLALLMMAAIPWAWERLPGRRRPTRYILLSLAFVALVAGVFYWGRWDLQPLDYAIAAAIFVVLRFGSQLLDLSMRWMFGYLRRPVRATYTLFIAFLVGWLGVHAANSRGMLIIDTTPVATAAGYEGEEKERYPVMVSPGGAIERPFVHNARCGTTISEPLYALDVLVPLIDLRQESRCEVGRVHEDDAEDHDPARDQARAEDERAELTPLARLAGAWDHFWRQFSALPGKENFWAGLKALYAVAGWFLVSLSILTFAQMNRMAPEP